MNLFCTGHILETLFTNLAKFSKTHENAEIQNAFQAGSPEKLPITQVATGLA